MTEETIWKYLDGNLSSIEQTEFEHMLISDPNHKGEYDKICLLHNILSEDLALQPSVNFVDGVMKSIGAPIADAVDRSIGIKSLAGLLGGFILVNVLFLIFNNEPVVDYQVMEKAQALFHLPIFKGIGLICWGILGLVLLDGLMGKKFHKLKLN